jgi:hypothetical protein
METTHCFLGNSFPRGTSLPPPTPSYHVMWPFLAMIIQQYTITNHLKLLSYDTCPLWPSTIVIWQHITEIIKSYWAMISNDFDRNRVCCKPKLSKTKNTITMAKYLKYSIFIHSSLHFLKGYYNTLYGKKTRKP